MLLVLFTVLSVIPIRAEQNKREDTEIKIEESLFAYDYIISPQQRMNVIKVGDSLETKRLAEEARIAEEKRQEELKKRTAISLRGTSYTGNGEAKKLYQDNTNNCVAWVKKQTGINHKLGVGGRGYVQGQEPKVGAVGVEAGFRPHAVLVTKIENDTITINESNYTWGWITERKLNKSDFLGFIYN